MAKQRYINTKFWDDTYIMQLDPIEKLLFLYFLSNPLTNISGIYEISLRRIAFDTGIDGEMIQKIFRRFEKEKKIFYKKGWIFIVNFIKNQSLNPSVIEGIKREIELVPKPILDKLVQGGTDWVQEGTLNLTKLNLTKQTSSKMFYKTTGERIVESPKGSGKLFIVRNGDWLEFAGKKSDIEYK